MVRRLLLAAVIASIAVAACAAPSEDDVDAEGSAATVLGDERLAPNGDDEPIVSPPEGTPLVELTQPELLATLERQGFHFGVHLGDAKLQSNDGLYRTSAGYRQIVDALTRDVDARRAQEPGLGTAVVTGRNRVFDTRWLRSRKADFELVGILPRFDRRDVQPEGRCGEVRFLYRLAYVDQNKTSVTFSRMPFFLNVVYDIPSTRCDEVARGWLAPGGTGKDLAQALASGPLRRDALELHQVEVNGQIVRVPSENEKDMGGRAEYFLRVFREDAGAWREAPLENTPDVAKLAADAALRAELRAWIVTNARGIDEGTAVMPSKFAATRAGSFTTFGSVRKVNKPFSTLFSAAELRDAGLGEAALEGSRVATSAEGLLFRLDDMTCSGCHQGRSVAGFHFLGKERGSRTNPLNALRTHASPHYLAERPRREALLRAVAAGERGERLRALSMQPPPSARATIGAHCTLETDAKHFRAPVSCEPGARCSPIATNAGGLLAPGVCAPEAGGFAGLPCLAGTMTDGATPSADKLANKTLGCAPGYACLAPEEGTPAGMCVAKCRGAIGSMNGDHEICAYGGGAAFDACAMSGNFAACIDSAVRPAPRQACDEDQPCREDYMCQRLEPIGAKYASTPKRKGYCNPTYFIFQMRLDGHPTP
jgi:hypothetical protein